MRHVRRSTCARAQRGPTRATTAIRSLPGSSSSSSFVDISSQIPAWIYLLFSEQLVDRGTGPWRDRGWETQRTYARGSPCIYQRSCDTAHGTQRRKVPVLVSSVGSGARRRKCGSLPSAAGGNTCSPRQDPPAGTHLLPAARPPFLPLYLQSRTTPHITTYKAVASQRE